MAFAAPNVNPPSGSLDRRALSGSNFWRWDLGLRIPAREGMALEFRAELFNLVNRTDFGTPDATFVNAWFGTISFMRRYKSQFALKFMF